MPTKLTQSYLQNMRERYQKSTKKEKTKILDHFCGFSLYSRKHASRVLCGRIEPRRVRSGPKDKYSHPSFINHLKTLWEAMSCPCGKTMKKAIPIWIKKYPKPLSSQDKSLLLQISASSIDRKLSFFKISKPRGLSSTKPSRFGNLIPLRTLDSKAQVPGVINSDTVAHCGVSVAGEYVNTVTAVDLFSFWVELRGMWKKDADSTLGQIKKIESRLPFDIIEWFNDNGNEFINSKVKDYFEKRSAPVSFKRTRAYRKNDACYVEQKNNTHVRKIMGYQRIECRELVSLINEIYQAYWCPLQNFFMPVRKLIKKHRENSKIKKLYDEGKTPYERLMECDYISIAKKRKLKDKFESLNPFTLKEIMDEKLKTLFELVDKHNSHKYGSSVS